MHGPSPPHRASSEEPAPQQAVVGLPAQDTLTEVGQRYDLGEGYGWLQEYCPACKRILRGQAYYRLLGRRFL